MKRALLLVVFAAACRPEPPQVTAIDAQRANVDLAELQQGRTLLVQKCGSSCHQTPMPGSHTALDWPKKLDEMSARAGLNGMQRALIEKYLVTFAAK